MQKIPQALVSGRVAGRVYSFVVLTEELRTLSLRKVPQDHHRVGRIFHRLRGHTAEFTPGAPRNLRTAPSSQSTRATDAEGWYSGRAAADMAALDGHREVSAST